ncbi:MAG: hypothetical protein KDC38_02130 [Planctomycetes bacterium]|nr:hypothetical protein [Planctomycetota bacterium]
MVNPAETNSTPLIRVQAASYREALERIQAEYGPDFRIVRTGVVSRNGLAGVVGGRAIEVFLAPAETSTEIDRRSPEPAASSVAEPRPSITGASGMGSRVVSPAAAALAAKYLGVPTSSIPVPPVRTLAPERADAADRDLQRQVRRLLRERETPPFEVPNSSVERTPMHARVLLEAFERMRREAATTVSEPKPESESSLGSSCAPGHPILRAASRLMMANGFSAEVTATISASLRQRRFEVGSDVDERLAEQEARRHLGELLRPKLPPCVPIPLKDRSESEGPLVIALVGPTGVGKTTTIAKLSAPLRLVHGRRVVLVTLDTYRLGAVEQIRRYGEIVGLEVQTVERPEELLAIRQGLTHRDLVFVDTAGSSPKCSEPLEHVRRCLAPIGDVEVHLCVSASCSRATMVRVAQRFRDLSYDRVLVTKGDESEGAGALLDLFGVAKVPVSYLTSGQGVPEDIATATADRLESLILGASS